MASSGDPGVMPSPGDQRIAQRADHRAHLRELVGDRNPLELGFFSEHPHGRGIERGKGRAFRELLVQEATVVQVIG